MNGLMLKDVYSSAKGLKMYAGMLLFFVVVGFSGKSPAYVSFMMIVVAMSVTLSSLSTDEYYHWDTYVRALPFSRREIVRAKYQILFIIFLIVEAVGLSITAATAYLLQLPILENLLITFASGLVVPVLCGIMVPVFYRFGSERGRIIYVLVCLLPTILIILISNVFGEVKMPGFVRKIIEMPHAEWILPGVAAVFAVLVFAISYGIAVKIYEKKEF